MTATGKERRAFRMRQIVSLTYLWFVLRSPEIFALSLALMATALILPVLLPQQPALFPTPGDFVIWFSNLPQFFQRTYQFFNALGLFKIYHSAWFWFPAAWLTLVSLVVLADLTPPTWQRLRKLDSLLDKALPHSLSRSQQKTIRLAAPQSSSEATATETQLDELKARLRARGFQVHPLESGVLAIRRAWLWSAPVLIVLGILLMMAGGVIQSIWGKSEEALLSTVVETAQQITFIDQSLSLKAFSPTADQSGALTGGDITLRLDGEGDLNWKLYRPHWVNGWWVIPSKVDAVAQVIFNQQQTVEKIELVFDDISEPIYFAHAPAGLTFELRYLADSDGAKYHLGLVGAAQSPGDAQGIVQQGDSFVVPDADLQGNISIEEKLILRAYKLPALPIFVLGGLIILSGLLQLPWFPPGIVRLKTLTKGRGSRIEVDVETLGRSRLLDETIKDTLILTSQEDQ